MNIKRMAIVILSIALVFVLARTALTGFVTASTGRLSINSEPPDAMVYIDGILLGPTPISIDKISTGRHEI